MSEETKVPRLLKAKELAALTGIPLYSQKQKDELQRDVTESEKELSILHAESQSFGRAAVVDRSRVT